jgi:hypothetical protein
LIKKNRIMKTGYIILFLLLLSFRQAHAQYITTIAGGNGYCKDSGDGGPAIKSQVVGPWGLCTDKKGNLYFAEASTGGRIRKISVTDTITTVAGGGPATATGDGIPATGAYFAYGPYGVCMDTAENLLIADGGTRIRKVNLVTGIITTVAGTLAFGYSGDGGPATAAKLNFPRDVAVDAANNIYIADLANNCIRKVDAASGNISTIAGTYPGGSFAGDGGPATAAMLYHPYTVYVDKNGDIYICDEGNNRLRKVTAATSTISTAAGNGTPSSSGDGLLATAAAVVCDRVIMDKGGNIYISSWNGGHIRKVDAATGIIGTLAGNGIAVSTIGDTAGNGGPATSAPVDAAGMCFDTCGNLYVTSGCVIRVITPTPLLTEGHLCGDNPALNIDAAPATGGMQAYPNPTAGLLTIRIATGITEQARIVITNALGQKVKELLTTTNKPADVELHAPPGIYFVTALTQGERWTQRVTVSP